MNIASALPRWFKTGLKSSFGAPICHSTFPISHCSVLLSPQTHSHPVPASRPGRTRPVPLKSNVLAAILALLFSASPIFGEGAFQRTRDGAVRVWNNHPSPDDAATWDGGKDSDGYASGSGTLTWWKGQTWTSRYTGRMVRGRFDGPVANTDADGRRFAGTYRMGKKGADWKEEAISAPAESKPPGREVESTRLDPLGAAGPCKQVVEYPPGPVPPGRVMVLPSALEVPAFLEGRPWHVIYITGRAAEKGPIRGYDGGGQLDFFTEITEPLGVCFGTVMLCTSSLPGTWHDSPNQSKYAYAQYLRFPEGVTRNDVIRIEAYWKSDGWLDYSLPMRIMYCENRQKYFFEGYCTPQGPNGRGTLSAKDVGPDNTDGRVYGIFRDGKLVKQLSLSEFASQETLDHLARNQRLANAQKQLIATIAIGTAITFGVYDAVGTKMAQVAATSRADQARAVSSTRTGETFRVTQLTARGIGLIKPFIEIKGKDGREYLVHNADPINAQVGDAVTITVKDGRWTEIFNLRTGKRSSITEVR